MARNRNNVDASQDLHVAIATIRKPITRIFHLLLVLLAFFALVYGIYLWYAVKHESLEELFHLSDFAAKSAEQYFGQYASAEYLLGREVLDDGGVQNPLRARILLLRFKRAHPELSAVNLLDARGQLLVSSQVGVGKPLPDLHFSPQEAAFFQAALQRRGLTIFRPRLGAILGHWTMPLFFPVRDGSGRLRFVVSAVLLMQHQQAIWRNLLLPRYMAIGLIRDDGYLQSRWPEHGENNRLYLHRHSGPLIRALQAHPRQQAASFEGETDFYPAAKRIGAFHRLSSYPMSAFVAMPVAVIGQRWLIRISVPLALLVFMALGGYVAYRYALRLQLDAFHERARFNQRLERRVEERTAELALVNKELEAFSYSVSHDLRAPLRAIDGFSQALLEDYAAHLDAEGRRYLERVRQASQRMAQLIDDLLGLSRVTRSELVRRVVDLSALAQQIARNLQSGEPERQVAFVIAPHVTVSGDARLLQIVLENLLGNAWKFTGKQVRARIEFGVRDAGDEPVYFVRDDGAGFSMAYADKLFNPFQRLHGNDEFEGTGIGLVTVQRIIHRHGGRVWAEGAPGQGATFYFTVGKDPDAVMH